MDCIAQQVLVLRRPNRSLQQVWCPTKLSRPRPQTQLQLQRAVQLRMRLRVTKFRESSDNALLPFDCTFFSSYCILYIFFFVPNTQHVYFLISCAWAKTRKTSSSYYLPDSFSIVQCPLQKKYYIQNKHSPYFWGMNIRRIISVVAHWNSHGTS